MKWGGHTAIFLKWAGHTAIFFKVGRAGIYPLKNYKLIFEFRNGLEIVSHAKNKGKIEILLFTHLNVCKCYCLNIIYIRFCIQILTFSFCRRCRLY